MSTEPAAKSLPQKTATSELQLLRLHIRLEGLSPMIWRRILIPNSNLLSDLHYTIQILFDWDNSHLNQFCIRGRKFGIYHEGGIWVEDAEDVKLSDFSFRKNEKFFYEYDLNVPWRHIIRVEQTLPPSREPYPHCISGQGLAPPADCGGYSGFFALQEEHCLSNVLNKGVGILGRLLDHDELPSRGEARYLQRWLKPRKIDRRQINRRLKLYNLKDPAWIRGPPPIREISYSSRIVI